MKEAKRKYDTGWVRGGLIGYCSDSCQFYLERITINGGGRDSQGDSVEERPPSTSLGTGSLRSNTPPCKLGWAGRRVGWAVRSVMVLGS